MASSNALHCHKGSPKLIQSTIVVFQVYPESSECNNRALSWSRTCGGTEPFVACGNVGQRLRRVHRAPSSYMMWSVKFCKTSCSRSFDAYFETSSIIRCCCSIGKMRTSETQGKFKLAVELWKLIERHSPCCCFMRYRNCGFQVQGIMNTVWILPAWKARWWFRYSSWDFHPPYSVHVTCGNWEKCFKRVSPASKQRWWTLLACSSRPYKWSWWVFPIMVGNFERNVWKHRRVLESVYIPRWDAWSRRASMVPGEWHRLGGWHTWKEKQCFTRVRRYAVGFYRDFLKMLEAKSVILLVFWGQVG